MKDYQIVIYKGKKYAVCRYKKKNGTSRLFVIDKEDLQKVLDVDHSWYEVNGYVGYSEMIKGKPFQYYLHNLIMDKPIGGGKGQKYTIDHTTRNTHDNRKDNLRLVTQTSQNENQKRRKRRCVLPDGCGIKPEDLPKCVCYYKPLGNHGEYFSIELKKEGVRKMWKSTKSVKVSLKDKLIEIKKKLLDISAAFPELIDGKNILENYSDQQIKLMKEFNAIIKESDYKCVDNNLKKIPKKEILKVNIDEASDETKKYLKSTNTAVKTGRKHLNSLPNNCGITDDMIPKYCYYLRETDKRGDAFGISKSNPLSGGKEWITSRNRNISLKKKFIQLRNKLKELKTKNNNSSGSKIANPNKKNISGSKTNKKSKTNDRNIVEI